jgi:hypothetical protein
MRFAVAGVIAMTVTIASWPTGRYVGVNYVVGRELVPLWKKASEFVERDARLRRISEDVLGDVSGSRAKADKALGWTLVHIAHAPKGKPVIDDHIVSIIERGYGESDQQADVFTALLTYAGVPAYWQSLGKAPDQLPISYALIDGRWSVFDVTRGLIFRTATGDPATPEDIEQDPDLVRREALAAGMAGLVDNYWSYFRDYRAASPPNVLRAELQMPWPRLSFELRKAMGRP